MAALHDSIVERMTVLDSWRRWLTVPAAALTVASVVLCYIYFSVYVVVITFSAFGIEDVSSRRDSLVVSLVVEWGVFAFFLAVSTIAARVISSRALDYPLSWGLATGCAAAVASWAFTNLLYPPARFLELMLLVFLGIFAGLLGEIWGRRAARAKRSFLRASEEITEAKSEYDVLSAIGSNLDSRRIPEIRIWDRIDLAENAAGARSTFETVSLWKSDARKATNELSMTYVRVPDPLQREDRLPPVDEDALSRPLETPTPAMLLRESEVSRDFLPANSGVTAILLATLTDFEGHVGGLLTVYLASLPQGRALREYRSIAGQASMRLTNLRLVAEAKRAAVSEERSRMGRELHDTVAQGLIGIITLLDGTSSGAAYSSGVPLEREEDARSVRRATTTASGLLMEVRRAVHALRNPDLSIGLENALDQLIKEFREATKKRIELEMVGETRELSSAREGALYGVAREALTNASRHADAKRIKLTLSYGLEAVLLDVRDDGRSFDMEAVLSRSTNGNAHGGGVGLRSMQERMDEAGGSLQICGQPGAGTTVTARLPTVPRLARMGDPSEQDR